MLGEQPIRSSRTSTGLHAFISVGSVHTCGVKLDKSVVCWGDNDHGPATPSGGTFRSISAGLIHTCGLLTDGYARYWGADDSQGEDIDLRVRLLSFHNGDFTAVSAGGLHTCGLRRGSAVCWGGSFYAPGPDIGAQSPAAKFWSISVGHVHTCGVTKQGGLLCWHYHKYGNYARLGGPGEFSSVSVGGFGACAVRIDGTLACWSLDELKEMTPTCLPQWGGSRTRDC